MIVKMKKYDFVLYHEQKQDFLDKLQDLGLVDITTTGWEPDENERELMLSIEKHRVAVDKLKVIAAQKDFKPGTPYKDGNEAFAQYVEAATQDDALAARIALAEKEADELRVWGEFNLGDIAELEKSGVILRYFSVFTKEFLNNLSLWSEQYNIVPIGEAGGTTYFVVVASPSQEVMLNAQEVKALNSTYQQKEKEVAELTTQREKFSKELARAAASIDMIEEHGEKGKEKLQLSQVTSTSREEAEGSLVIMEGWAPNDVAEKVDQMLIEYPALYYIKSSPTPQDDTPTLLKNNKFSRMFEIIGNFYSQPKYGTLDLTSFFGPFYALFFGLCLADAGYGLLYFVIGLLLRTKLKSDTKGLANLVTLLGFSTMVCGFMMGSFFGLKIYDWAPLASLKDYVLGEKKMFSVALWLGLIQLLYAMILKVYVLTKRYGFKYALSTLGWVVALYSSLAYFIIPMLQKTEPYISTNLYMILVIPSAFLMFFMNSPGKNPFMNFGAGLWNLYNDITGFLSDALSYIRLFAIGLSGGILASVFNDIAVGMSGNIPVVKQLVMLLIILVGHGLNLFMSTISSFVHPMRLTFVEFYKNAGFEDTQRVFEPLKRHTKNK